MRRYRALIFDVDGTIAETEEIHRRAFNDAFAHFGLDWYWDRSIYSQLLQVTGGKERMRHFSGLDAGRLQTISDGQIGDIHRYKTARYASLISEGGCPLRPGVVDVLNAAVAHGMRLAIATTTSRSNVEALVQAAPAGIKMSSFDAIVTGDEIAEKKPAPDVYLKVLDLLGMQGHDCLAIEDSRNGLVSASLAGIPVLITRSYYFETENFDEAFAVVDSLDHLVAANFQLSGFELKNRKA